MITRIFGAVTGGLLNLRAAAASSASILASIPNETLLVVTEHNDTWYATTYGSYTGFVMKQYITRPNLAKGTHSLPSPSPTEMMPKLFSHNSVTQPPHSPSMYTPTPHQNRKKVSRKHGQVHITNSMIFIFLISDKGQNKGQTAFKDTKKP